MKRDRRRRMIASHPRRLGERRRACDREKCGKALSEDFMSGKRLGWFVPLSTAGMPISVSPDRLGHGGNIRAVAPISDAARRARHCGSLHPGYENHWTQIPPRACNRGPSCDPSGGSESRGEPASSGSIPVENLPRAEPCAQVNRHRRCWRGERRIRCPPPIAPIRNRRVVIDPDRANGGWAQSGSRGKA